MPPPLVSPLQRLVEAAEEAHLQHNEDPDLQVLVLPPLTPDSGNTYVIELKHIRRLIKPD